MHCHGHVGQCPIPFPRLKLTKLNVKFTNMKAEVMIQIVISVDRGDNAHEQTGTPVPHEDQS